MRKAYLYDQGVVNAIARDFREPGSRPDIGRLNEHFAFWEIRKSLDIRYSLFYWRTTDGKEVDFVLEKDRQYLPIEVKSAWTAGKVPPGIRGFFSYYPETRSALVLYDGTDKTIELEGRTIRFAPLYKASRAISLL